ncbi:MAG: hypothetical protein L0Z53_06775 [Acidobacteriales bacterium]|nr:hypothetical protein [Terriglobales bacterium]
MLTLQAAKTYNAAWFAGATIEAQIQNAINSAAADGAFGVSVPLNMIPFNASLVVFNSSVRMFREGNLANVYDIVAYGAALNGVTDDAGAVQAAINAAQAGNGPRIVDLGHGISRWNSGVVVNVNGVQIVGSNRGTEVRFQPTASGPAVKFDGAAGDLWDCIIRDVQFTSTDTSFTKEMIRAVNVRRFSVLRIFSQDGLWNGAGSIGLRLFGRDLISVRDCWFAADQPLKIEVNPNLVANALDFAVFEHNQFAVQSGVSAYNVEIADGVTWSNNVFRDCDGARGLGFARWTDTTSSGPSFANAFEGVRQEQSIVGSTYSFDLGSTVQQLQMTVFSRCSPDFVNIDGIKLRRAFSTFIDTFIASGSCDALNCDANCRGLTAKNFWLINGATTTGLSNIVGFVEIDNPDIANIGNQGDADATLTTLLSARTQRFTTTLTANRVVTLSTTNAHRGAKFRVVRTGLGAFTLDVGGLKTIPSATAAFVNVEHDGSGWRLTGYGTL